MHTSDHAPTTWPVVGDEVDVESSPKVPGPPTRGILMNMYIHDRGAQAYVVSMRDGVVASRICCPVSALTGTGRRATSEEIRTVKAEDDLDERDISKLVAECARLREFADVMDVLRMKHPDAVRTLREWNENRKVSKL